MKKIYLFKMFLMAFVLMLLGGVNASAEEVAYKTLTFNKVGPNVSDYKTTWTATIGNDNWSIVNFNNNNWKDWNYIRCGSKKDASVASITTSFSIDKPISSVVVTIDKVTAENVNSTKLYVSKTADFKSENIIETVKLSIGLGDLSFKIQKPQENCYYKLEIDCKKASNGFVQISKVVYNYGTSSTSTPTTTNEISFSKVAGTYEKAPVSVELSASVDGSTIYYSTDGSKPTIDDEHKYSSAINITKSGTVLKVLATAQGYDDAEAEATYTIKPDQPVFSEDSKTFKEPLNVTLSLPATTGESSKIYYAIGKTATAESTLYDGNPITIDASNDGDKVILHAIVVDEYGNVGKEKYNTYTKTTAVIFDFTAYPNVWGIEPTEDNKVSNTDGKELVVDGVTLTTTSSSSTNDTKTCIYGTTSGDLRVYTGGSLTFTAPKDYTISKIVFTGTVNLEPSVGTLKSKVWTTTDGVNSVVFTRYENTSKIETAAITLVRSVENKTMVATDKEAFYSTFSSDRAVVFTNDVNVYAVNVTEGKLELAELTKGDYNTANSTTANVSSGYYVPANTGVLIKARNEDITYYTAATGQKHANIPANNQLVAATADGMFTSDSDHKYYKLAYDDYEKKTGLGFYYGAAEGAPFVVKKGLAYLAVPVSVSGSNLAAGYAFGGNGGDDTTGINGIENDNVNETQTIYNMQGQRVEKAGLRGIYIVNGKKVVLK